MNEQSKIDRCLKQVSDHFPDYSKEWRGDVFAEMRTQIEARYNDQLACGLSSDKAIDAALEKLGNPEKIGKDLLAQLKKDQWTLWAQSKHHPRVFEFLLVLYIMATASVGEVGVANYYILVGIRMLAAILLCGCDKRKIGRGVCLAGVVCLNLIHLVIVGVHLYIGFHPPVTIVKIVAGAVLLIFFIAYTAPVVGYTFFIAPYRKPEKA
jgi:uncharacterized membrane protein